MVIKSQQNRRALGKGLGALLPSRPAGASRPNGPAGEPTDGLMSISIELIDPNPFQPRRNFQEGALEGLAQSIRTDGLVQPIVVHKSGLRFTLIAGERRLRAAKLAGLTKIPALIREITQDRILEVTLVENIQRENLNPIEIASALERMIEELQLSHEEVATRTGKDRSTITNLLRLLSLPSDVRNLISEGSISGSHARAIAGLEKVEDQRALANKTVAQGLSVRQVESAVRKLTSSNSAKVNKELDPNISAAMDNLEHRLKTKVRLVGRGQGKGKIEIEYYSPEDLERIYSTLMGE
jgi:ParB family chromosome partitioning protein